MNINHSIALWFTDRRRLSPADTPPPQQQTTGPQPPHSTSRVFQKFLKGLLERANSSRYKTFPLRAGQNKVENSILFSTWSLLWQSGEIRQESPAKWTISDLSWPLTSRLQHLNELTGILWLRLEWPELSFNLLLEGLKTVTFVRLETVQWWVMPVQITSPLHITDNCYLLSL